MKKLLFIICFSLFVNLFLNAQTNSIGNTGNVGIGTLNPNHELTVEGASSPNIELKNSNYSNGGFVLNRTNYGNQWKWWAQSNVMYFDFATDETNYSNKFTIKSSGNVGIGSADPKEKFQIGNAFTFHDGGHEVIGFNYAASGGVDLSTTGYAAELRFDSVNGNLSLGTSSSVTNAPSSKLFITKNGYVGIGTSNPSAQFHVNEGARIRKTTFGVTSASGENSWIRDEWLTGNYGPAIWNQSTSKWVRPAGTYNDIGGIVYQNEGTYFLRQEPGTKLEYSNSEFLNTAFMFADIFNGNVGIGTITPDSKLTVAGKIHAQEVKVTISAGADFVFSEDYKLPLLESVDKFIKEHKHLPEIASEKEMQEKGLLLAKMNIKLLQKIEELTLYTINQEKRIETLEKENNTLKTQEERITQLEEKIALLINAKK